jgi:predicted outer membrane repeat protein
MSSPLLRLPVLASIAFALASPVPAAAQVTTSITSTGTGIEFGNISSDARKTVGITGRSRVVDVDVRFDAGPGCSGSFDNGDAPIAHPRVGDFSLSLLSPEGTLVSLSTQRGGARDNFCTVVFDDDGGFASIATLTSVNGQPVSGSFAPESALSAFDGEDPNGGWSLRVNDVVAGTSGRFNRFTLVLQTEAIEDIVVDVLDDPAPAGCTPGSCSLREAVLLANTRPGLDRIVLPSGELQLARAGANEDAADTGDLDVTDALEILGQGVDATRVLQLATDRLLHNLGASELTVRDVTLSGGKGVALGGAVNSGGRFVARASRFIDNRATYRGGAIFHSGGGLSDWPVRLELIDTEFIGNLAEVASEPAAYGGAIYGYSSGFQANHGLIDRCTFVQNESEHGGGAIALGAVQSVSGTGYMIRDSVFDENRTTDGGHGGAIGTNLDENGIVSVTIIGSSFSGNVAGGFDPDEHHGGAIRIRSGSLIRLADSVFSDNEAASGGALELVDAQGLIEDSTFAFNQADVAGGAIYAANGVTMNRSTLHDNSVTSTDLADPGGGALAAGGNVTITRSTFDNNIALRGGAITSISGNLGLVSNTLATTGANFPPGADATILRYLNTDAGDSLSFFANIIIGRCIYTGAAIVPDSAAYNIEASGNTCRFNLAPLPVGNKIAQAGTAVGLALLADNGGPTPTRMPAAPSIAIDAASNLGCPLTDQRGYVRVDATCDIGAVEAGGLPPTTSVFADGFES